ncbi:hypothetical protein [Mycolicibacter kumamotonensis]|jgi:hypothetical protein|uniref:Integral membrane protein n=1 Tax=Mycolicibacter kumamotonensis TaxID=354243 RepID=A0A1B8SJB2_9MYCO|nr:hypothetical protein [Mycolicibacter kumamotonensis]NDJ89419.1 hypothetical protein [Mycolicibacter kumamotonensis]OBY32812.1 hypothetical protein ACT18_05130 [Mycolicibacter kumamotonensis]ORA79492.1 hypothetical protein BST28_11650 [Mycolicibacter kumamotonensis]
MKHSAHPARSLPLALSAACGLAMAAAAGSGASGIAAGGALLAAGAVLAGLWWRPAATAAVLLAVAVIGFADAPTVSAAVAGLAAVGHLLLRHAADGATTVTGPALLGAAGFSVVGVVAASFPLQLPWLPLAAAPAALGCYVLALRPYLA